MYLAVDSGMRWGELIGLRRKNLDLANRRVRVVDQLVRTVDGTFHRPQPKTSASIRSIIISKMTAEVLAVHLERFAGSGRDGLVFPNTAGNPLAESSFYVHHFKKAQEACGLRLRFHDLRHTSVALAIAGGAHPKAIQARMGHSSIAVTLDRYGHLLPSLDADIDLALTRVAARVAVGGHDIPEETVRRRFTAGLRYFFTLYRFRVDEWALYDNEDGGPVLIASGDRGSGREDVLDPVAFAALQVKAGVPTQSKDGRLEP